MDVAADRGDFNWCLEFPGPFPEGFEQLVSLLETALCLPAPSPFDLVLALDRYKIVDEELPPEQWENTEAGELVHKAKYYLSSPQIQRSARESLTRRMANAIWSHPVYRDAPYLISVPGSSGRGNSTGEQIARLVAAETGKQFIQTVGPARPQRKADPTFDVSGLFSLPSMLSGSCVIIDDVWHTGATCVEVARTAKLAGADAVYGLVAARTMRN
ncbi:ComF family protein [Gordonia sp. Z-3]|uniref:ComF family protein n=1 Tax=Gordonia sp. Z-3 TaxID=3115408 RepID=UPI002E284551|nr:hypothetical protein [Gordonia sp. Z-3]